MLYWLEIENFFSVRDRQTLDLTIAPNVTDPEGRFAPLFPQSALRAPKVVALYGANASGKTTVLRALQFLINFAKDSAQRTSPGFALERFNDEDSMSRPIKLAIEFSGIMDLSPERRAHIENNEPITWGNYRYELELEVNDGLVLRVASET